MPLFIREKPTSFVGTNPEVGGSSPFQLVSANSTTQVINPAGAITVRLPSTGILTGEKWTIQNRSTNLVSITSQDGDALYAINLGDITYVALQDAPTDATHWQLVSVNDEVSGTIGSTGDFSSGGTYRIVRSGKTVTMAISSATAHSSLVTPTTATGFIPTKFAPTYMVRNLTTWNSTIIQMVLVNTNGSLSFSYKDWAGINTAQTASLADSTLSWVVT